MSDMGTARERQARRMRRDSNPLDAAWKWRGYEEQSRNCQRREDYNIKLKLMGRTLPIKVLRGTTDEDVNDE